MHIWAFRAGLTQFVQAKLGNMHSFLKELLKIDTDELPLNLKVEVFLESMSTHMFVHMLTQCQGMC